MWDAARWLAGQPDGTTYIDAAQQFGVTHEAVRQAWNALALGETPLKKAKSSRRAAAIALARDGKTMKEIAAATGASLGWVQMLKQQGITIVRSSFYSSPKAIEAGLEIVRHGGTVGEGAAAAGLQYASFHRYVKKAGISPGRLDATKLARAVGRGAQGALLVKTEGMTAGQAAMVVGVAPMSVRRQLQQVEEDSDGVA
jgi:transposase